MPRRIKVASWNIAGARKMRSLDHFDYADEDIDYFAAALANLAPDIVCLQEAHTNDARAVAAEIARKLGFAYVYNTPVSPSHIDSRYRLGNAVISRFALTQLAEVTYPYPIFGDVLADGRPSQHHDKILQIFQWNDLLIANTQMLPLGIFGRSYDRGEGRALAQDIQHVLANHLRAPFILCGDMNVNDPATIYPDFYQQRTLREALPNVTTRPNKAGVKKSPDHILYTQDFRLIESGVVATQSDHYLCWALLEKAM